MDITYFTSESVTCGHPDKVCDQIADAVLDALLEKDPESHVACEVSCTTDQVHIFGEVSSTAKADYETIARETIRRIGYTEPGYGFDAESCRIIVDIHEQSPDIARGVRRKNAAERLDNGAGDQGMMFGYACSETESLMPFPIEHAHALAKQLETCRRDGSIPYLLPDGKTQVTVEYRDGEPYRIDSVVISAQHCKDVDIHQVRSDITSLVILPVMPANMMDDDTNIFVNPTGRFVEGGPAADSGLTGRKIIVDTYGGYARHGGGSFSGKDASKVDRSGAYMARFLAKNIVAAKLAERCEVQLSYAIGMAEPTSVLIECFGTEKMDRQMMYEAIRESSDLRPEAIIHRFDLKAPRFSEVSCYGHFGFNANSQPWEQTNIKFKLI